MNSMTDDKRVLIHRCCVCKREFRDGKWGRPARETCACGGSGLAEEVKFPAGSDDRRGRSERGVSVKTQTGVTAPREDCQWHLFAPTGGRCTLR
jgi:hypothetical protein